MQREKAASTSGISYSENGTSCFMLGVGYRMCHPALVFLTRRVLRKWWTWKHSVINPQYPAHNQCSEAKDWVIAWLTWIKRQSLTFLRGFLWDNRIIWLLNIWKEILIREVLENLFEKSRWVRVWRGLKTNIRNKWLRISERCIDTGSINFKLRLISRNLLLYLTRVQSWLSLFLSTVLYCGQEDCIWLPVAPQISSKMGLERRLMPEILRTDSESRTTDKCFHS